MSEPKILVLDIEWKPTTALVWKAWDENVGPDQIVEHGGLLCVGAKWLGDKKCALFSEWEHGHKGMVEATHSMMLETDLVITYNGDKYDLPKLYGEFVLNDLPPTPPLPSVDVLKAVKKFGFFMNRLGFIGPFLGVGAKLEHEGINLWKKVMAGDANAQKRMAKYCVQDVRMLEQLYLKVRPYIRNHPHTGGGKESCPSCGSKSSHSRGNRTTRAFRIQRLQCQDCGHWFDGVRSAIKRAA
jgi:hypothetical protein